MKKVIYLLLVFTLVLSSCSSDDNDADSSENDNLISVDENKVPITSAIIEDFGSIFEDTYYTYDFLFTGIQDGKEYFVVLVLLSPNEGTSNFSFRPGTFNFANPTPTEPTFHLESGELSIDDIDQPKAKAGQVIVAETGEDSYDVSATITLENDEIVTLKYNGKFKIVKQP